MERRLETGGWKVESIISRIPEYMSMNRWEMTLNGEPVEVRHFRLLHPEYGSVEFGLRPEGFLGWVFSITGAIRLPYFLNQDGRLWVGLLPEVRVNMGEGEFLSAIGGYVPKGETHDEAARRESEEEAGIGALKSREARGISLINQRTHAVADVAKGEGVRIFFVKVPIRYLRQHEDGTVRIADYPSTDAKQRKLMLSTVFMPWAEAIEKTADPLAGTAIGRLVAELHGDRT